MTGTRPPSCATPRQPTIFTERMNEWIIEKLYYLKSVQLLSMIIVMIEGKSATRNKIIFVICYTSCNNKMLKERSIIGEYMKAWYKGSVSLR